MNFFIPLSIVALVCPHGVDAFLNPSLTRFSCGTVRGRDCFRSMVANRSEDILDADVVKEPAFAGVSRRSLSVESFKVMDVLERANELQSQGKDVLHCEVGQPESGCPSTVAEAAVSALTGPPRQVMGYTDAFGLLPLRENICQHYLDKYSGVSAENVDTSRIVVTTGSSGGFLLAFTACFDTGDTVAIASSGYPCYRNILGALGCELANIGINSEFKITALELKEEIERRREMGEKPINGLILSSPSNPTGSMLTPGELKDLCQLCDEENIQFISDEIYHGISYGKEEATALQFSNNAIVINSFSKYYSMSGWRLGWMVIPQELVEPVNCLQQNMFINAPTISQTAALKCWDEETIAELEKHVEKYRTSRSVILDELSEISELDPENIAPADGGFYVYVDLGENNVAPGLGSVAMCKALLEEEYVAFTPGNDFEDPSGNLGDRRFRISYAGGIETAKKAMERFHNFWPTWMERVQAAK
uniref:Aminotransferase class I/classII large domain-containing protein n=1 Tax=Helicotheca tamesis TaxID=374047 RepID=A0A7S2MMV7_9STRA|mmetsp:Transcript_18636/g.25672  ORF Transcript_18636/g.25672 Transcript_18636/m.25672 type:complete len:479 (+) Transcript_18636:93-1529(+)|eukprot:CAMPEP_0185735028 /NCGR_PEP_ID=MMETSP1171-20130828/24133_1 /TAXON_ID=374046 /ORGANISM="Helicotheca tamensis, Strain CCMP826" /LENGTH=478 /DNA_ID=CAMNT_0028405193 /DNA_START=27 /DNA_END=1463 /DNA_ORIENTATION=+